MLPCLFITFQMNENQSPKQGITSNSLKLHLKPCPQELRCTRCFIFSTNLWNNQVRQQQVSRITHTFSTGIPHRRCAAEEANRKHDTSWHLLTQKLMTSSITENAFHSLMPLQDCQKIIIYNLKKLNLLWTPNVITDTLANESANSK
jgi:hypothetical protein